MGKKENSKKLRSVLAILLVVFMMLGMIPEGIGQVYAADVETQGQDEQVNFFSKAKNFISDVGEGIADFFTGDQAEPIAAFDTNSVVDADTSQGWKSLVQYTTENIGRIWTDKSVYNDSVILPGIGDTGSPIPITKPEESDFMVGLSALSSTSNTSMTTSVPLDIVLVLDVSGSMNDSMGTTDVYEETYNVNENGTYYALNANGEYEEIKAVTTGALWWEEFDHWELNGVTVEPKTRNDNDTTHIQFYTRREVNVSKIDALKTAVNGFIDATATQNETIADPEKKHHISVVKYATNGYYNNNQDSVGDNVNRQGYNYSQIVSNLTGNMDGLKSSVNGLEAGGATSADFGMNLANRVLNSSAGHGVRQNAQKIVIMFTDGEPNHSNGFDVDVANDTIASAKTIKDTGAFVYTIAVVNDADPDESINTSTETNINAYLHSVSSNYPNADGWKRISGSRGSQWQLGDRAENSNYYKAATNSNELNTIFKEISEEINTGTGYPTQTEEGFANRDGYVIFHDELGDYMQVDSFNTLVLEDQTFAATQSEGEGVVNYTYSGIAGEDKDVSNIVITVTRGTGSMGDTIEAKIPAALLPLRNFNVDITENTMTVEEKYPLRLFYNASLREEAKESLTDPDQEMKNYIAANNSGDGSVYFYSNKFTNSKPGPNEGTTLGDTVATFEPATGNTFYYFTENTFLWADEAMSEPVTSYNADKEKYFYEKTYYEMNNNGEPKEITKAVSFLSHPRDEVADWIGTAENGQLYIKAGAPRLTRIHDLTASKENPIPGTATEVITPNWDDELAQRNIEVSLGNNGRLEVELPGTLEIKKTVVSEVDAPEKDFSFKLSLTNAEGESLTGEFDAQKFDTIGVESGDAFKVKNHATVTLKDGEFVKIYGLSNGDKYKIEETEIPKGFTAKTNPIEGTIVGNKIVAAAFENTYAAEPVTLSGENAIQAKKELEGRDWQDDDKFDFELTGINGAPLPKESTDGVIDKEKNTLTKSVTNSNSFSFGDITFDRPGTYIYTITEPDPAEGILGIDYSDASYRVTVNVSDNQEGKLTATSEMRKMLDDDGKYVGDTEGNGTVVDSKTAVFTNMFVAQSLQWGPQGDKVYVDHSGKNPLQLKMFKFQIEPVKNEDYPEAGPIPGEMEKGVGISYNGANGHIYFEDVTFDGMHIGKTYLYKITEVIPEGAADNKRNGMTYDSTVYYVRVAIDEAAGTDGKAVITSKTEYLDSEMQVIPGMSNFTFSNEYTPTPVIIGGQNAETAIKGFKTLNGRTMNVDEFSFELTAGNNASEAGLADDSIVFEENNAKTSMTANVPAADNGETVPFYFGSVKFTKPGNYAFNMKEVVPEPAAGGITYDTHTEVVTVTVTDHNGVLEAKTTYDADGVAFVNTYEASHTYGEDGGALVTKTLNGRGMTAGEFNFTIAGTGDNADAANKKLTKSDEAFKNYEQKAGAASNMPKLQNVQFTEEDAGKTFTYLIDEVMPKEGDRAGGVTYDQSEFTLAITVADNGDGTMRTTTTVTRIKTTDGTAVNEELGTYTEATSVVSVPFVNVYKAVPVIVDTSDTEAGWRLRKVLRGRDWTASDSFVFTMKPQGDAPMPIENPEAGITSDGKGNLQAVVTAADGTADGTQIFFGFGSITYEQAGTYVYTVTENRPESLAGGMTYSENVVTITVRVTDPGTGALEDTVSVNGTINNRTFYNDYEASLNHNAAGGIVTRKTLTGHVLTEGQFTFKVEALAGDNTTAEENAKRIGLKDGLFGEYKNVADEDNDGIAEMKTQNERAIAFTNNDIGKTFKYQFSEQGADNQFGSGGTKNGYIYDDTIYTVELWVTDDLDGTLTLHTKVTDQNGNETTTESNETAEGYKETILAFNNSYAATGDLDGTTALEVTKVLEGREWNDNDSFNFRLEATGDTVQAVENGNVKLPENAVNIQINKTAGDHKASFGNIIFKKAGEYTFAVSENIPGFAVNKDGIAYKDADDETKAAGGFVLNGITYTAAVRNITVDVTDNGNGTLAAIVRKGSDKLVFTNEYKGSSVTLDTDKQFKVTKTLVGRVWTDADAFEFKLTAKDGAPMPAEGGDVVTAKVDEKTKTFGAITYEEAGNYEYQITEIIPETPEDGMTYDTHVAKVTVKVEENFATGTLSVTSVTYSDGNEAKFTNVVGNNTKEVKAGKENVNNGTVGVGEELTYVINWINDGVDKEGALTAATVTITDMIPKGTEYVADSAGKNAVYDEANRTLTWTIEAEAAETGSVSFKVVVTNEAGGTDIENQGVVQIGDNEPDVTNKVQTNVPGKDSAVEGGGELQVGSVLIYTISYKNPEAEAATVTITDVIPEGLDYVEGTASDNAAYKDGTLTWILTNVPAGQKGTVTFKARVNESAETTVENKAAIQIGENSPKYSTDIDSQPVPKDGSLAISKKIILTEGQGTEIDSEKEFTFTVNLKDQANLALNVEYAYTIKKGEDKVSEGKVKDAETILLKDGETATITGLPAGTRYTVTETPAAGYTPDAAEKSGSVTAEQTAKADFTNTYSVEGSLNGNTALKVVKKFTGRENDQWLESDKFTFTLSAADKATQDAADAGFITLPETTELTIDSTMEEKQAAFGNIKFSIEGTFKFNVTEQVSGIAGVTDDKKPIREIVVGVADNQDGTLKATVEDGSDNLVFVNTYGAETDESEDIAARIPATKKLTGRDMDSEEFSFEVVTRAAEGIEDFIETVVATGKNAAGADGEAAKVAFAGSDANGAKALNYTTESLNEAVAAGYATKSEKETGDIVWTVNYTAREKMDSLPKGVTPAEGKTAFDFTIVIADNNDGTLTAEVQTPEGGIAFENNYATGGTEVNTDPTETAVYFNKRLTGRNWLNTDVFTFTMTPKDGAPSPEGAAEDGTKTVIVTSDSAKEDVLVPFGFGKIMFTDAHMEGASSNTDGTVSKTFTYEIKENPIDASAIPGVTIDHHLATLIITVTDNLQGNLSATAAVTAENGTFTNIYRSNLDYNTVGGLQITKVLHGRDMEAGQFTFGIKAKDTESAEKFGFEDVNKVYEFTNKAADAEMVDIIDVLAGKTVTFTQADLDKTYTYEVFEKPEENTAYTYDEAVRTVTIHVIDNKNGTLTAKTTVTKGSDVVDEKSVTTGQQGEKAIVAFENTYEGNPTVLGGEGNVKINAMKSLTNRPMEEEEFTFNVLDKQKNIVSTGTNSSDGNITFTPIEYTTDKLIADAKAGIVSVDKITNAPAYVYIYDYDIVEDESNFADGVTSIRKSFAVKVVVTDDGNGKLSLEVVYPNGLEVLPFENAYGTSAEAEITVNGNKKLEVVSGNNAPDITGKYTFTISGVEEGTGNPAPMPELSEAVNDQAGNVSFGKILYTMENVFGNESSVTDDMILVKSAERIKTFVYTVQENGDVQGVVNDPESKTFTVTVADNGDGTIKVVKNTTDFDFTFTNSYGVDPVDYNISTDLSIKKELTGRELKDGEFTFELVNEDGEIVEIATNKADGSVTFETPQIYTEPGEYNYVIREQNGNNGGVQYDSAEHTVTVVVTDNGNGTLSAKTETKSKAEIVFKNIYETTQTSVILGASKVYNGAELEDKQFTFELKDQNGEIVSEAKNRRDGLVVFETITYDKIGTYKYVISEKNDKQKNVTYDKTTYEVTVKVTDNGEGSLIAEVVYADGKAPVFTNVYTKPVEPSKPTKPEEPKILGAVQTGDNATIVGLVVVIVVAFAAIIAVFAMFFRRKSR